MSSPTEEEENSWLISAPRRPSTFQTISVSWQLGLDVKHQPVADDELRIIAGDGGVVARALLRDIDHNAFSNLRSASMKIVCPGFGGEFVVALYDTLNHQRFLASPLTVEGTPLDRGEGKIHVATDGFVGGRLEISYSPEVVFGGTFVVCLAGCGDNDGHLASGLFSERTGSLYSSDDIKVVQSATHHSFTVFAPSAPGEYQVKYVKAALCAIPHCVACSVPFTVRENALGEGSTGQGPHCTELDLRRIPGSLTVFPTSCFVGETVVVSWNFETTMEQKEESVTGAVPSAPNLMKELTELDSIQFCPFGRQDLISPSESLSSAVNRRMLRGSITVTAPTREGTYDATYFALLSHVPLLRSADPLKVKSLPCKITRTFQTWMEQGIKSTTDEAETVEEAGRLECIIGAPMVSNGRDDFMVATAACDGSVLARVPVQQQELTPMAAEEKEKMMDELLDEGLTPEDIRKVGLLKGSVILPLEAMVKLHYLPSKAVNVKYFSSSLGRFFGETDILIDRLSEGLVAQIEFPDVDILTPALYPAGEEITLRLEIDRSDLISRGVLAICDPTVPDTCFRTDADDGGTIQTVSSRHFVQLDRLEKSSRHTIPALHEPGFYMIRFYAFLGHEWTGPGQRTCFCECQIQVSEHVVGFKPLPAGNLPPHNPSDCLSRYEGAAVQRENGKLGKLRGVAKVRMSLTRRRTTLAAQGMLSDRNAAGAEGGNLYRNNQVNAEEFTVSGESPAVNFVRRDDYSGAIVCNTEIDTEDEISATLHLVTGSTVAADQLIVLDEHCSCIVHSVPLRYGAGRPDGSLVTVIIPPIEVPGRYMIGFLSAVLDAVPIVSKPITVNPHVPNPAVFPNQYLQSAQKLGAAVTQSNVEMQQPPLLRVHALLVSCSYVAQPHELYGPHNDATTLETVLRDTLRVPTENISTLHDIQPETPDHNSTCGNILRELETACNKLGAGDTFIFYFSGLGSLYSPLGARHDDKALLPADFDWGPRLLQYRTLFSFLFRMKANGVQCQVFIDAGFAPTVFDVCKQKGIWKEGAEHEEGIPSSTEQQLPWPEDQRPLAVVDGPREPIKSFTQVADTMLVNPSKFGAAEGIEQLRKKRALANVEVSARSRSIRPPAGMLPSQAADVHSTSPSIEPIWRHFVQVSKLFAIPHAALEAEQTALAEGAQHSSGGGGLAQPGHIVVMEAGKKATWEIFDTQEGKTLGIFTSAVCKALRAAHSQHMEALKRRVFMQMKEKDKKANFLEMQLMMAERKNKVHFLDSFSTWEEFHESVIRLIWNSPYRSQKPQMHTTSLSTFVSAVFDMKTAAGEASALPSSRRASGVVPHH